MFRSRVGLPRPRPWRRWWCQPSRALAKKNTKKKKTGVRRAPHTHTISRGVVAVVKSAGVDCGGGGRGVARAPRDQWGCGGEGIGRARPAQPGGRKVTATAVAVRAPPAAAVTGTPRAAARIKGVGYSHFSTRRPVIELRRAII